MLKDGIETIPGKTNPHVLLIAPHGYPDPDNDENTGALVREMQKILDCPVIINEVYRKPLKISENPDIYEAPSLEAKILDLNRREHAEMHPTVIKDIKKAIENNASTFVLWIHGIKDENLAKESKNAGSRNPLSCLIGYGQGKPKQFTCKKAAVDNIIQAFQSANVAAAPTDSDSKKYRGHHPDNMNQWFKQSGYKLNRIQSIQLEFGFKGLRDPKSVDKTARKLAGALLSLNGILKIVPVEKAPNEPLVADTLKRLSEFFNGGYHTAMEQAGDFIIERFYGREPERVIERKPVLKESLLSLIKELQEGKNKVPSKSWFYNARDLAAHEQIFKKRGFQIFGNLGHSHKLALLSVRDLDKIQALATAAFENKYNVEGLKNEIKKGKPSKRINLEEPPTIQTLEELEAKELERLHARASNFVINNRPKLENYEESLKRIDQVIAEKAETEGSKRKKGRFRDWTRPEDNVNFCTGCENDCLYCYMKPMADNRPTWKITSDTWHQMRIRQDDVDAKQKRHAGLVGFPSSHDILPSNIDKALIVLGKLLRAGNEVLIVSKPRIECIQRICEASQFYKDKILFRFTIGAMDNNLLRFWEPNASTYEERKACLEYALKQGFRTSVSMEPMLDTRNIDELIKDLSPLASVDIWLGTMNHEGFINRLSKEGLKEQLAIIEAGQTPERLLEIYRAYENNPKIKWKTDAWKLIEQALKAEKKVVKKEAGQIKLTEQRTAPTDGSLSRKRFSGWDKIEIEKQDGTKVEAIAPVIISASRHTDLPAFYGEWLMNGLRRGYLERPMPRNPFKTEHISFEKTRLIVFWTKNPEPLFRYLDEIDKMGIGYYFQYTMNDYEVEGYEPNIPPLSKRLKVFKTLSKRIGPEKVIWRFDPFILSDVISKERLVEKVYGVMSQVVGHTRKMVLSFFKPGEHKTVGRNLSAKNIDCKKFAPEDVEFVAHEIGKMCAQNVIDVSACAEGLDLSPYGIGRNKCIDDVWIRRVFPHDERLMVFIGDGQGLKDTGQRPYCECIVSRDIGEYNTCDHSCAYCYANDSEATVKKNLACIDQTGEMLLHPKTNEGIGGGKNPNKDLPS